MLISSAFKKINKWFKNVLSALGSVLNQVPTKEESEHIPHSPLMGDLPPIKKHQKALKNKVQARPAPLGKKHYETKIFNHPRR